MREIVVRIPVVRVNGRDRYVNPQTGKLLPKRFDASIFDGDWTFESIRELRRVDPWDKWTQGSTAGLNAKQESHLNGDEWSRWIASRYQVAKARLRILKERKNKGRSNAFATINWGEAIERMERQIDGDCRRSKQSMGWERWATSISHNSNVRVRGKRSRENIDR